MARMVVLHHFAYGWFNPVMAYLIAFLGALLGLFCTARARNAGAPGRKGRWLALAAICIGGIAIWLMHFMAMLGFDVPASQVRYDPLLTAASLAAGVVVVGAGLVIVGFGGRRPYRVLLGGMLTGYGAAAMHYTGMTAVRVGGEFSFDRRLVGASIAVAVFGCSAALWLAVGRRGWAPAAGGAAVLAGAVVGMHYTGMYALRVRLDPVTAQVDGLSPLVLVVPITVVTAAALIAMAFSALQAMTEEEFDAALSHKLPAVSGLGGAGNH